MSQRPASYNGRIQEASEVMNDVKDAGKNAKMPSEEGHAVKPGETIIEPKLSGSDSLSDDIIYGNIHYAIELEDVPSIGEANSVEPTKHKLRELDGGWGWVVLAAAFVILVCVDGVAFSFGVMHHDIAHKLKTTHAKTSLIGSMFIAIPLLTGPIMSALVDRYGCRVVTMLAGLATSCAFILAAASTSVPMLWLTYGVIGGLTCAILHVTAVVSVALWFNERRNLALSIISCSFGVGPLVFSPMIQHFLNIYSMSAMLFIVAGVLLHVCVCGALMRNPPSLEKEYIKKMRLLNGTERLSRKSSLSSSEASNSSQSLDNAINNKPEASCNPDPPILPVLIEPVEPTNSGIDNEMSNDKKNIPNPIPNTETQREKNKDKKIQFLNWCKIILSDHNYLKGITLYRNNMVYGGAMTSIPKYRLRYTSRPDVYANSYWSLNSEDDSENVPCLRIWMAPKIKCDGVPTFTNSSFIMFNVCFFNFCAWSTFPYFFLKSFMDKSSVEGGTTMICIIGIGTIIGTVFCVWVREKSWMNVTMCYRTCLMLCGLSLVTYPHINYWAMVFNSIIFGMSLASCHSLISAILLDLMPMDKFTMGHCVILLVQGIGYLVGPPIGGMLYDVTGEWLATFWTGGSGLILSGICSWLVEILTSRRDNFVMCPFL